MVKEGITIITFNSRVDSIRSRFFIGQNAYKGGRTAAELITKLIPDGKIGLIISSMLLSCHEGRSAGFCDYLNACGRYSILAAAATQDMDSLAYEQTLELLHQSQDIRAIYITGGGVAGVGKALKSLHLEGKVHVICHDITPDTEYLLREKIVDFVIDQDPVRQGRLLVSSLYEYYMYGKPLNAEAADIPITIRTRETL
jgi:LacI family transcriptional regulator